MPTRQGRFLLSEKRDDLRAAQPSFDDHLFGGVDAVNLKPVLGKIETDRGNMHSGRLLSVVAFTDDHVMAHRCRASGGRPPHQDFRNSTYELDIIVIMVEIRPRRLPPLVAPGRS